MPLDAADRLWLEELLDRKIQQHLAKLLTAARALPEEMPMPLLTVEELALATGHHVVTLRRKIRVGSIPRRLVFGERPFKISPKALDLFGVTPHEARRRIEAHRTPPALLQFGG